MTGPRHTPAASVVKIHVPFAIRRHGGRKVIISPEGQPLPASATRASPPLLKALARAFRWRKLLEGGDYATLDEIARAERINPSYVSRVLRLTLLAPNVVEGILDGRCTPQLKGLFKGIPVTWNEQAAMLAPALDAPPMSGDAPIARDPGRRGDRSLAAEGLPAPSRQSRGRSSAAFRK